MTTPLLRLDPPTASDRGSATRTSNQPWKPDNTTRLPSLPLPSLHHGRHLNSKPLSSLEYCWLVPPRCFAIYPIDRNSLNSIPSHRHRVLLHHVQAPPRCSVAPTQPFMSLSSILNSSPRPHLSTYVTEPLPRPRSRPRHERPRHVPRRALRR